MDTKILKCLNQCKLFHNIALENVEYAVRNKTKGEAIYDTLSGTPSIGVIAKGIVSVRSLAYDGNTLLLTQLKKGDCFGICNLFASKPLPTYLECQNDVSIIYIAKDYFVQLMQLHPLIAIKYATLCNEKILFLNDRIEFTQINSCKDKIIRYLLLNTDDQGLCQLNYTKQTLANLLGVSRSSLFRELANLQNQQLITINKKTIVIHDISALEKISF